MHLVVEAAIRRGDSQYYASGSPTEPPDIERSADFIGWVLDWAERCGDRLPTADGVNKLVVPYQPFCDIHQQYVVCCQHSDMRYKPLSRQHAAKLWSSAPLLRNIVIARPKLNFQRCATCVALEASIRRAARKGERDALRQLHHDREVHLKSQMEERALYYSRRWKSSQEGSGCLSLILDKWNASTTVVPFFQRSPGAWFQKLRKGLLHLSVLLVTLHTSPRSMHHFYVFNKSLKGDSNMNIEGIRRSLVQYSHRGADGGGPPGGHIPGTFYVQADSAGDNKSQWLICWLAWLVHSGYVAEVYLSFLVVGHTHEDVDQMFSIGSKFLFRSTELIFTLRGFLEALHEAYSSWDATFTQVATVLDWKLWFGAHSGYGEEMCARACMRRWGGLGTQRPTADDPNKRSARAFWV